MKNRATTIIKLDKAQELNSQNNKYERDLKYKSNKACSNSHQQLNAYDTARNESKSEDLNTKIKQGKLSHRLKWLSKKYRGITSSA